MADEYLSGDVRAKLRMAQFAAETNPEFAVNVDALTKHSPENWKPPKLMCAWVQRGSTRILSKSL